MFLFLRRKKFAGVGRGNVFQIIFSLAFANAVPEVYRVKIAVAVYIVSDKKFTVFAVFTVFTFSPFVMGKARFKVSKFKVSKFKKRIIRPLLMGKTRIG